jgi:hypothetical protein
MHFQAALARPGSANGVTSAVTAAKTANRTKSLAIFMDLMSYPTSRFAAPLHVVIPLLPFRLSTPMMV